MIGERTLIRAGARIRGGCSIGPVCKVGGEVEASVIQGTPTSSMTGFWATPSSASGSTWAPTRTTAISRTTTATCDSSAPRRRFATERARPRGRTTLGITIGDLTKTGISTSFTTGSVIGVGCNLYGTALMPAYVPSFVWGSPGSFTEHRIDAVIETAAIAMERRKVELRVELDSRIRQAFDDTRDDRALYLGGGKPAAGTKTAGRGNGGEKAPARSKRS